MYDGWLGFGPFILTRHVGGPLFLISLTISRCRPPDRFVYCDCVGDPADHHPVRRGVAHIKVEAIGRTSNSLGEPHPVDLGVRRCSLVSVWVVCRIWQY